MLPEPMVLSDKFHRVLDLLEHSECNLFVTGRAGTGKSTLLHLFKKTTNKGTVILAPTGNATLYVQGQTIDSFLGFRPGLFHMMSWVAKCCFGASITAFVAMGKMHSCALCRPEISGVPHILPPT